MARSASVTDSEGKKRGVSAQDDDARENEDAVEDEEEGEEYEIEEIIDAQRGQFEEGRWGYLVKWKGYGPEENSWVDENDAGNATELIEAFWKRKKEKEKKAPRKSSEKTSVARKPRKSSSMAETPEPTSTARKRGRKSQSQAVEVESEDEDAQNAKKQKKAEKKTIAADSDDVVMVDDEIEEKVADMKDMKKFMKKESWEDMVDHIDTVEKQDNNDGELIVYFRLTSENGGGRVRLNSSVCNRKFPQKMLKFYESNLKWKEAEVDDEEMIS